MAAPGVNILTTQMGGGYWTVSGTSASAPLVTGVAGLIKTARPWLRAGAVVKAINDGARKVSSLRNKVSAGGVLDAGAALAALHGNEGGQPSASPSPGGGNGRQNPHVPTPGRGTGGNGPGGSFQTTPPATSGVAGRVLPDLNKMRNVKGTPLSNDSTTIRANLLCADCDPQNGGGNANSYPTNDRNFSTARNSFINRTGEVGEPGGHTGQIKINPGSRNVNWATEILSLPGRNGMDLSFSLSYNSLIWTRDGSFIKYNADHGTPAPGFRIGFPVLQQGIVDPGTGNVITYVLDTPAGGRVEIRQTAYNYLYESADNSYLQLQGVGNYLTMRDMSGTRYEFAATANGEYHCYQIMDRNGNYISIEYFPDGHLKQATDTLGRVVKFNYDQDGNLDSITQDWGVTPEHQWAKFYYGYVNVGRTASNGLIFQNGLTVNGPGANGTVTPVTVLTKVTVNDGSSYVFDYNAPYGQVKRISHVAKDNVNHVLSYTSYNMDAGPSLSDCPRFSEQYDWAENWNNGAEANTSFSVTQGATWTMPDNSTHTGTLSTVMMPDRQTVQKIYAHSTGFDAGLPVLEETWFGSQPNNEASRVKQRWVTTAYTQDDTSLPYGVNARPAEVNIYDTGGNHRRTTIAYNSFTLWSGESCSLPSDVYEYAADAATVLRKSHTDYLLDTTYIWDKHIIGLPAAKYLCNGLGGAQPCLNTAGSAALLSKVTYDYDQPGEFFVAAGPIQHANLGYVVGRGNLVQETLYDVKTDVNNNANTALSHKYGYDDSGNIIFDRDESGHQTNIEYTDSFSDGVNRFTYAYPTAITDPDQVGAPSPQKTLTQYNYAIGAVTRVTGITPYTGQTSTPPVQVMSYDSFGRLEKSATQLNGADYAYTRLEYPDTQNIVKSYTTTKDLTAANEAYAAKILDGAGRTIATASALPGNTTAHYSAQQVVYDVMGQVVQKSNPTEVDAQAPAWNPVGDDVDWVWTGQTYDWKGRPRVTTLPDGSTRELTYGGCGCAGGEVTTTRDERGRRRVLTKDVLGRAAKLEELDWNQSVYSTTIYTYDARDLLTQIDQQGRLRKFEYDGFGRLTKRTTPEQGETNYTYNPDGTLYTMTDARQAKSTFTYYNRHQVKDIVYETSSTNVPVAQTAAVHYDYDAAGNRQAMTDGLGTVSYVYDQLSRLKTEARHFNAISNPTPGSGGNYTLTYTYNLADQLMSVKNPFDVSYFYTRDNIGRINTVTGDPHSDGSYWASTQVFVNAITYRAFGAAKKISYGQASDTRQLSLEYDNRLRLTKWDLPGVLGYSYSYNYFGENSGRVTFASNIRNGSVRDPSFDRSYDYDHLGRLIAVQTGSSASAHTGQGSIWGYEGPYAQGFDYDVWGNITHREGWGGENNNYTIVPNAKNQLPTNPATGAALVYDPAGNLTNDGGQSFQYDATGQQTSASNNSTQMAYDGDHLRGRKTENGATTYYVRSSVLGGQVMADLSGTGSWLHGYVYLEGELLAYQENGRVLWVHDEPVTKGKRMTDSAGNILNASELDPFGGQTDTINSPNGAVRNQQTWLQSHRYSTYERDANSSDDAMHRRYNRWWSRFDQPDPTDSSYDLSNPQSFNRYAYVQNDPVSFTDPSGLDMNSGGGGGWSCTFLWAAMLQPNGEVTDFHFTSIDCQTWGGGGSAGGGELQHGGRVRLTGSELADYLATRKHLLELLKDKNSDCAKYLRNTVGVSGTRIARTVNAQRAFNGRASTISLEDAGILSRNSVSQATGLPSTASVSTYFGMPVAIAVQAGYARPSTGATFNDVYFLPVAFFENEILHEALHTLLGVGDTELNSRGADPTSLSHAGCNINGKAQ